MDDGMIGGWRMEDERMGGWEDGRVGRTHIQTYKLIGRGVDKHIDIVMAQKTPIQIYKWIFRYMNK